MITKNKSLIPLALNSILGSYKFSLQANVDHRGNCIAFIILLLLIAVGKYSIAMIMILRDVISVTYSSTIYVYIYIYIYILLYKLIVDCVWADRGGLKSINYHGTRTFACPMAYSSKKNAPQPIGLTIRSSWWPQIWFGCLHELCIYI